MGKEDEDASDNKKYRMWKGMLLPVLYDWYLHHNLVWPSLSCRWGPLLEEQSMKRLYRLYLAEQTDGSVPNTLVVAKVAVVKPRVVAAEHINGFKDGERSPFVRKLKTIYHPGEVNSIREYAKQPNLVATHTDAPEVFIWNVETQPDRIQPGHKPNSQDAPSTPDLVLVGHSDNAEFALEFHARAPMVASGGKDTKVLLWSLEDQLSSLLAPPSSAKDDKGDKAGRASMNSGGVGKLAAGGAAPRLKPRLVLSGHESTVEDVKFHPFSADELCSVGDDSKLLFWDARAGAAPVLKVAKAHSKDIHCVDWSALDPNLVVTGSADCSVKVFDRRKLAGGGAETSGNKHAGGASALHTLLSHTEYVNTVRWSPDRPSVFGSGSDDSVINIWDVNKTSSVEGQAAAGDGGGGSGAPPQLMFQHVGHRSRIVDLQWNTHDPWVMMSASEDLAAGGGGTLQIWRMNDLLYRPEAEVLQELESFRSEIFGKGNAGTARGEGSDKKAAAATGGASGKPHTPGKPAPSGGAPDTPEPTPKAAAGEGGTPGKGAVAPGKPLGEKGAAKRKAEDKERGPGAKEGVKASPGGTDGTPKEPAAKKVKEGDVPAGKVTEDKEADKEEKGKVGKAEGADNVLVEGRNDEDKEGGDASVVGASNIQATAAADQEPAKEAGRVSDAAERAEVGPPTAVEDDWVELTKSEVEESKSHAAAASEAEGQATAEPEAEGQSEAAAEAGFKVEPDAPPAPKEASPDGEKLQDADTAQQAEGVSAGASGGSSPRADEPDAMDMQPAVPEASGEGRKGAGEDEEMAD